MKIYDSSNVSYISRRSVSRQKIFLITLVVTLLSVVFYLFIYFLPLPIKDIQIFASSVEVEREVAQKVEHLYGASLKRFRDEDILDSLKDYPLVFDIDTRFVLPDTLQIYLKERLPIAVMELEGFYSSFDADRVLLASSVDRDFFGIPLMVGDNISDEDFKLMVFVLQSLPKDFLPNVDRVELSSPTTVQLLLFDGSQVIWGDASNSFLKARILDVLVSQMRDRLGIYIYDVSTPNTPVTR